MPRPLSTPATVPPTPPATPYFSQLTPTQHHLVQHAAAALLLKDRKRGTLHDDFEKAIGGIEHLVERLEESIRIGVHSGKGKRLTSEPPFVLSHFPCSRLTLSRSRRALWDTSS